MSEDRTIHLRFANEAERKRHARLRKRPELHDVMSMGANLARDYLLPRIQDGRATWREGELDRQIAGFLKAGSSDLTKQFGRKLTADERFMLRIGYEAEALAAKDEHLKTLAGFEKLGEAHALAQASVAACNEGLRLLGQAQAPALHLLATPSRRPLRPEDFGALPAGPR
ncbi:MAG: hypothetical protein INR68_18835, partial [Methylobacterium mesophilicum]|nr:hypothetical protein [Methylobacterium mesophilicum]